MYRPLALIVLAEFFGTSLWFSANSAADDLMRAWAVGPAALGPLTGAVQAGFIAGTLTFSLTGLADHFRASRIFAWSAVFGAAANAGFACVCRRHRRRAGVPVCHRPGACGNLSSGHEAGGELGARQDRSRIGLADRHAYAGHGAAASDPRPGRGLGMAERRVGVVRAGAGRRARDRIVGRRPAFAGRPPPEHRQGVRGFSCSGFPRGGVRLFWPHVGALCHVDHHAVAGSHDSAPRRMGPAGAGFAGVVRGDSDRRAGLHHRRALEPTSGKCGGGGRQSGGVRSAVPGISVDPRIFRCRFCSAFCCCGG